MMILFSSEKFYNEDFNDGNSIVNGLLEYIQSHKVCKKKQAALLLKNAQIQKSRMKRCGFINVGPKYHRDTSNCDLADALCLLVWRITCLIDSYDPNCAKKPFEEFLYELIAIHAEILILFQESNVNKLENFSLNVGRRFYEILGVYPAQISDGLPLKLMMYDLKVDGTEDLQNEIYVLTDDIRLLLLMNGLLNDPPQELDFNPLFSSLLSFIRALLYGEQESML